MADREFMLPDGTAPAQDLLDRLRLLPVPASREPRLLSWSEVVELADQGLYLAKRSGRNALGGGVQHAEDRGPKACSRA